MGCDCKRYGLNCYICSTLCAMKKRWNECLDTLLLRLYTLVSKTHLNIKVYNFFTNKIKFYKQLKSYFLYLPKSVFIICNLVGASIDLSTAVRGRLGSSQRGLAPTHSVVAGLRRVRNRLFITFVSSGGF